MKSVALAAAATLAATLSFAAPASAHGNVSCHAGPQANWSNIETLKRRLVAEGWTIKKAHVERDCYEVYGKTPEGDNVESFFHPVSLQKLLVLKRGRELYRAPGFGH